MPNLESAHLGYLLKSDETGEILIRTSEKLFDALTREGMFDALDAAELKTLRCIRLWDGGRILSVYRPKTYRVHIADSEMDLSCEQYDAWCELHVFAREHGMASELQVFGSEGMVQERVPVRTKPDVAKQICNVNDYVPPPILKEPKVKIHPKLRKLMDETPKPAPRDIDAEWAHWARHGAQELEARRVKEMLARRKAALPENPVTQADADMIKDRVKLEGELHWQLDRIRESVLMLEERIENAKEMGLRKGLTNKVERVIKFIRDDDRGRHVKA